ncbi:MAG TPA: helix-turn-helix transcriptional regulator [Pyrinomonadaceae bacterium]|jgi:transcriptional regulator with XRE-family HTH domain|nr:helix-turn-helix transcriptional regulator [Pyrinomonadaceae bacterium]
MGNVRPKPKRLAEKLRQIRETLGLSQTEMLRNLGLEEEMKYARISEYETGQREPSLLTLLAYSRVAGIHMEVLADDEADLPDKLPAKAKRA